MTEEAKEIIGRWGNQPVSPETFVFPMLEDGLTPERELALTKQFVKTTNKYLKRIGERLELDLNLTTYVARHSFATVLKRSGAPVEFISERMGHGSIRTPESYLGDFEDESKKKYAAMLTAFEK